MTNQLQEHIVATFGTKQRILAEAIEETLLKRFLWQHSVTSGVSGHPGRYNICKLFSGLLVSHIAVQSVITDSVKSLRQNVLNHTSDELKGRQSFVFNLSCFVVTIPVADRFAVISFNSANRNRRRNNIFCQVFSQSLSSGWYIAGLKESNKAFGIIFPCPVNVFFNGWIGNLFSEHFQEMVLPFSMHHVVRNVGDIFPLFQRINSTCGHEDMKMWIVMAGATCGLENNDVSDVEFYAGRGVENIFEAGIACSHERAEQFGITIKPCSQELRHGQDHMPISYAGKEASSDEICPSVGIALCTAKTEAGFAGEGDATGLSAVATSVLHKAHFVGITAVEHFLDVVIVIRAVETRMDLLKRIPVIVENLFEGVFFNAFHGCSLRTTIAELRKQVEERIIPLCISS